MELTKEKKEAKGNDSVLDVQSPRIKSEPSERKTNQAEVPNIRLSPDQIEEIHSDEYALTLFYATRVQPLSVAEIKKQFPEPEPKKAVSVLERFVKVGLVHITQDGNYYSNYPENYINYSNYRYDSDLEAKKDAKVFRLMKEFTGNKEYWKNKSYFSMDAFYTEEQTKELQEMFRQIKIKAKDYANENAKKKSIKDLIFRRLKFYDMTFSILLGFFLVLGFLEPAKAGGNDPTIMRAMAYQEYISERAAVETMRVGGGNDPTAQILKSPVEAFWLMQPGGNSDGGSGAQLYKANFDGLAPGNETLVPGLGEDDDGSRDGGGGHDPTCWPPRTGGGGHDPADPTGIKPMCCIPNLRGEMIPVFSENLCKAQYLLLELVSCAQSTDNCVEIERELHDVLSQPRTPKQ